MHTYKITLVPKGGGTAIEVRVQADSDAEARRIALASHSGYQVRAVSKAR